MTYSVREGFTFNDLLLVPQYSDINSRADVDLSVKIKNIKYSHPIIPANMQSITGEKMAEAVSESGGLAIIHRFMDIKEQLDIAKKIQNKDHVGFSVGVGEQHKENVKQFIDLGINIICVDIAHGDSKHGCNMTEWIRSNYPNSTIISGNVATGSGAKRLWDSGADVVKVGIGPGCFAAGTRILMSNGFYKNIEDVKPDDYVINMFGNPVKVLNSFSTGIRNVSRLTNSYADTYVTSDHQFWVLEKESKICKWKAIKDVKKDNLLLPKTINFSLSKTFDVSLHMNNFFYDKDIEITPTYDLGYLFGTFLANGDLAPKEYNESYDGIIKWHFNYSKLDIVNKLSVAIKNIFDKDVIIQEKEDIINVNFYCKSLSKFLDSFDEKLPENLLVDNKFYLKGLYDGLLDSCTKISNESKYTIELFNVLHCILFGNFLNCKLSNKNLSREFNFVEKTNYNITEEEVAVYDITVDCDTHSFIANNMIVHNSLCSTRIETGNGVPQLSALMDVAKARLERDSCYIISDGGVKNAGDFVKALCFSDMVMAGNIFAGCEETPGPILSIDGKFYKEYKGSSTHKNTHIEGVTAILPAKGKFKDILSKILEGLSSGCSYQGVNNLIDLKDNPEFIRITHAGLIESFPHDIT